MRLRIFNEIDIGTIGNAALGLTAGAGLAYGGKKLYDIYRDNKNKQNTIKELENELIDVKKEASPSEIGDFVKNVDKIIDNNPSNEASNVIKSSITETLDQGWLVTLKDRFSNFLGLGPNFNEVLSNENFKLSNALTNLFESTNIHVNVFPSKKMYIYSFPGEPNTNTPFCRAIKSKLISFWNIGVIIYLFSWIEFLFTFIRIKGTFRDFDTIIYNPDTKKFKSTTNTIQIYMSSSYFDVMQNDDELIAICLAEMGVSLQLGHKVMESILGSAIGIPLAAGITADVTGHSGNMNPVGTIIFAVSVFLLTYLFLTNYFIRRRQIHADELPAKCGYGEAFSNAIKHLNGYTFDSSLFTDSVRDMNFIDRICHFFTKFTTHLINIAKTLWLMPGISTGTRQYYADKNATVNYKDSDIDRTANIN